MDLTEDELLAAIRRVLDEPGDGVVVGVGDDAAVVRAGSGDVVLTTDGLVEGSHFVLGLTSARDLGYKAVQVNVSDVAAMAGSPRFALCALTLSDAVDAAWTMELVGGMREACAEHAVRLIGGNLARGSEVSVAVSVMGEVAPGRAVTRAGAGVGDHLVVTGTLGGSAAGLRVSRVRKVWSEDERDAIHRHFRPVARVGEAAIIAGRGATAMMDISDGLGLDLTRLCAASAVGARVDVRSVPVHPAATLDEAMGGGEDYELLATVPSHVGLEEIDAELGDVFGLTLTRIGSIVEGNEVVDTDGTPIEPRGWDHFRGERHGDRP
jgi:thiamine-monophosphate kinase